MCGQLVPLMKLKAASKFRQLLQILDTSGVTRKEQKNKEDPVTELDGPVLDRTCNKICDSCRTSILKGNVPSNALANGLWIGEVPEELSSLRFVERLLIARVRSNVCFVRVASGSHKMISHVMAFESPVQKIYHALPPPREDLDDVLAILFTGPIKPRKEDYI